MRGCGRSAEPCLAGSWPLPLVLESLGLSGTKLASAAQTPSLPPQQLRVAVDEKNRMLRQIAGGGSGGSSGGSDMASVFGGGAAAASALAGGVVEMSDVAQRWDGFTLALQQVRAWR